MKTEYKENELWKEFAITLEDSVKACDEISKTFEETFGVLSQEIKLKCAEKFICYADKYSHATFLTRWYWLRKMRKFVKGINVLKEL